MAEWKTRQHLEDHYSRHRGQIRARSIAEYDASAQETIVLGQRFEYRDGRTNEPRIGYYHRDTARFVGCDVDELIRTHHVLDEDDVYSLPRSTYWEE
jgi:hypothetical protein